MDGTITREKYEEARAKIIAMGNLTNGDIQQFAEAFGITVEPEPEILPDVTRSEWEIDPDLRGIVLSNGSKLAVCFGASCVAQNANTRVMAGSKKLVELVGELLARLVSDTKIGFLELVELQAIIKHLDENMGADVKEFLDS